MTIKKNVCWLPMVALLVSCQSYSYGIADREDEIEKDLLIAGEDLSVEIDQRLGELIWRSGGIPLNTIKEKIEESSNFHVEQIGYSFLANGMTELGSTYRSVCTVNPPVGVVIRDLDSGEKKQLHLHVMIYYEDELDFSFFDMSDAQVTATVISDYMEGRAVRSKFVVTGLAGPYEFEENKFLPILSFD